MQSVFGDVEEFRAQEDAKTKMLLEEYRQDYRQVKRGRPPAALKTYDEYKPIPKVRGRKKVCTETRTSSEPMKPEDNEERDSPETVEPIGN